MSKRKVEFLKHWTDPKIKIISGGQTGVDQAALDAATLCGFETGGWAPKGWRTLKGPNRGLEAYGLKQMPTPAYRERTWKNVEDSDLTVRIFRVSHSPGELCTSKACLRIYYKQMFNVDLRDPITPPQLAPLILSQKPKVINIAGNSEQTVPGIYHEAFDYIVELFDELKANH